PATVEAMSSPCTTNKNFGDYEYLHQAFINLPLHPAAASDAIINLVLSNNRQKDIDDLRIINFPGILPKISNHIFSRPGFAVGTVGCQRIPLINDRKNPSGQRD